MISVSGCGIVPKRTENAIRRFSAVLNRKERKGRKENLSFTSVCGLRVLCGSFRAAGTLLLLFILNDASAADLLRFSGIADLRVVAGDDANSWLNGGNGRTRYGGETAARIARSSLVWRPAVSEQFSGRLQINLDAEPGFASGTGAEEQRLGIIEGFAAYRYVATPGVRFRARAGIFFPPVSLENSDSAWTSPYALTTSAINSWIGEEVRTTGVEVSTVLSKNFNDVVLLAAAFRNNDPTGSLLAWRGWALHDRQTSLGEKLPLPPIDAISAAGLFPKQPQWVQPTREVDGRTGYYLGASWERPLLQFNALYFNNRSDQDVFDGKQYAWDTQFTAAGARVHLVADFELLGQWINGQSRMGVGSMVHIAFDSAYVMLTGTIQSARFALRYDRFDVDDRDFFKRDDDNTDHGSAWTLAAFWKVAEHYQLVFEALRIRSDQTESQFQSGLRITF